jgi:hypothetical protein
MRQFGVQESGDADFWKPAALIARLATDNRSFNGGAA